MINERIEQLKQLKALREAGKFPGIPCEYDESRKEDLIEDLKRSFNRKFNQTSHWSCNGESYYWRLPRKNSIVEELKN